MTPEIKDKLDVAAKASGRTQSQEAELRLEQSFREDRVMAALERIEAKLPEQAQAVLTKQLQRRQMRQQTTNIIAAQRATTKAIQAIKSDLSSQR